MMNKEHIRTIIGIFLFLSLLSLLFWSGAPLRVHAVDITAFFIAFVIPGILGFNLSLKKQLVIWFVGGIIGPFLWDVGSSYVVEKRELFMGWTILYPLGLIGLCLLQIAVKWIERKTGS
jgi:hypothetical protein